MSTPLYRLTDIRQIYNDRLALEIPRLDIAQGLITGLAGHNGSGKSTLLRILAFLEHPATGSVHYQGRLCREQDLPGLRREVTLLTQEPYLLKRSVAAIVGYGLKLRGRAAPPALVHEALHMVGLAPERFAGRSWQELSGGEAQRVALAQRLVLRPRVLLLDEPTASLDRESAERVMAAALTARDAWHTSLVIVSHDHRWLRAVCDRMLQLEFGRLVD